MHSKRAVSNIVLMMGIVMAIAVLLIGGMSVVFKLVEGEARASPKFIATDLVSIINTLQSAPETVTYQFYTPQDDNGYPLIGSLEVDDDTRQLCVSKKTEDEMIGTIAESAGISAFGTGGQYAYQAARNKFKTAADLRALNKMNALKAKYGTTGFAYGIPSTTAGKIILSSDDKVSTGYRKLIAIDFSAGGATAESLRLSEARGRLLSPNNPLNKETNLMYQVAGSKQGKKALIGLEKLRNKPSLYTAKAKQIPQFKGLSDYEIEKIRYNQIVAEKTGARVYGTRYSNPITEGLKANPAGLSDDLTSMGAKASLNKEYNTLIKDTVKVSRWNIVQRVKNLKFPLTKSWYAAREANIVKTAESLEAGRFSKTKAFGGKIGGGLFVASVVTMGYLSGDWTSAIATSAVPAGMMFFRHFAERLVRYTVTRFSRTAAVAATAAGLQQTENTAAEAAAKIPPTFEANAVLVATGMRIVTFTIVLVDSIYNAVLLDWWILEIRGAASSAVNNEKNAMDCEPFTAPKKVLLTPPNCNVGLQDGPAVKELGPKFKALEVQVAVLAGYVTTISAFCSTPGTVSCRVTLWGWIAGLVQVGGIIANVASDFNGYLKLATSPTDIIPTSVCMATPNSGKDTCDRTYMRQDCPNWYISDIGNSSQTHGKIFFASANAGMACAALSWEGWAAPACNIIRYVFFTGEFIVNPGPVTNWMLQGYNVGLTKNSISAKPAPDLGLTDAEFADNEGYWYAELPFAVEFTKIYTDNSTQVARTGNFIIRKI
jgi:hypothetical protein